MLLYQQRMCLHQQLYDLQINIWFACISTFWNDVRIFFDIHFQWTKHIDNVAKKNWYLSQHMAVHFCVIYMGLDKITSEWHVINNFLQFIIFYNNYISDPVGNVMTLLYMSSKFFDLANEMLLKQYQVRSPQLLSLVLMEIWS